MRNTVTTTAIAEAMLDVAAFIGISLDDLERVRRRFEGRAAVIDAAEPSRRGELLALMEGDMDDLAEACKRMAMAVKRGGGA